MNPHGRVPVIQDDPTPSCATSPRAMAPENSGPAIRAALKRCTAHFEKLDRLLEGRTNLLGVRRIARAAELLIARDSHFKVAKDSHKKMRRIRITKK
jgi:glutathione S-transferase